MMQSIRDLVANDGYAITFQTMGQYRTALLAAIDKVGLAPDLEGLATRLLASDAKRSEDGFLVNPAFPILDEGDNVRLFLEAFGIECRAVSMESDCDDEALCDAVWAGEKSCGEWIPTAPEGEGWILSDIYDTEDGPYALFIRRKPQQKPMTRRERMAAAGAEKAASTAAARDVLAERGRQSYAEGWTPEHDDGHCCDEIAALAAFYAMPPAVREWPAESTGYGDTFGAAIIPHGWAAKPDDRRRELVKAGALILAEIERLDRAAMSTTKEG